MAVEDGGARDPFECHEIRFAPQSNASALASERELDPLRQVERQHQEVPKGWCVVACAEKICICIFQFEFAKGRPVRIEFEFTGGGETVVVGLLTMRVPIEVS